MTSDEFTFVGNDICEMIVWLHDHDIDVVNFDKKGLKTIRQLWAEHQREVVLRWDAAKERVLRVALTARVVLVVGDSVLREVKRVYPRGEVLMKDWWSISETRYKKESSPDAAIRGLRDECGLTVTESQLDGDKWAGLAGEPPEPYKSTTYPGIWTSAIPEWIEVRLDQRPWEDPPIIQDDGVRIHLAWDTYRPPFKHHWLLK